MAIELKSRHPGTSNRQGGLELRVDAEASGRRTPMALHRYESDEPLEDACLEVWKVLQVSRARAIELVTQAVGEEGQRATRSELDRLELDVALWITQPIRKPHMIERMSTVLEELASCGELETVLDYGGGGGRDSILYRRLGYDVTLADLTGPLTRFIERRFDIRGMSVDVTDVRDLGEERYDVVNCMDVVEHVYDVEYVLADIAAHLRYGGHLVCYPAFINLWDGDHIEKNCGYVPYWTRMLESIGFRSFTQPSQKRFLGDLVVWSGIHVPDIPVVHLVRERSIAGSVAEERETIRQELYELSAHFSTRTALKALSLLPFAAIGRLFSIGQTRIRMEGWSERLLSTVIDNFAIRRLSRHRLQENPPTRRTIVAD